MAAIPTYRAEMVGLAERDRTLLRSLLAASQARTGIRWDGGPAQPAVHFIDMDGQEGAAFWQSLSEADRRDAVVLVSATEPANVARWLPKPMRSVTLLRVLEQLKQVARAPAAPAVAAAPQPAATPGRVVPVVDPNDPLRLLDVLDDAAAKHARVVQSEHWPDLVLGSGNTHAMRTAPLESYVEGFAASVQVTRVAKYTGGPIDDEQRIDLDTLRWLAVLHAPLAEVARRLPHPAKARLSTLPAFGQLPHTLAHVRMAAWMTQHAASPQELAEMSGADDEAVLRFLGACEAIGLLQEVVETPAAVLPPVPAPVVAVVRPLPVAAAAGAVPAAPIAAAPTLVATPATAAPRVPAPEVAETVVEPAPEPANEAAASEAVETAEVAPAETTGSQSVLERLRASREQNRARVAAAIRGLSTQ